MNSKNNAVMYWLARVEYSKINKQGIPENSANKEYGIFITSADLTFIHYR